jgi:hypothetical protein
VYGLEDALVTVSEFAASKVDGRTSGYNEPNTVTMAAATSTPSAANACPSRPLTNRSHATGPAMTASASGTSVHTEPERVCTTRPNASIGSTATGISRSASRRARSRNSPSVLRARYTAPCASAKPATASPPSTVSQRTAENALPTLSPRALSGRPSAVVASSSPTPNDGSHEPITIARSQFLRQRTESTLPR